MNKQTDLTFLKTFTAGDTGKMSKYINMFLSGAPQLLTQVREQSDAADWKGLKTTAHSLKTQLKYMGVNAGVDHAFSIEQKSGEQKDLDQVPALVTQLEEVTNQAI